MRIAVMIQTCVLLRTLVFATLAGFHLTFSHQIWQVGTWCALVDRGFLGFVRKAIVFVSRCCMLRSPVHVPAVLTRTVRADAAVVVTRWKM